LASAWRWAPVSALRWALHFPAGLKRALALL
jgi:hypothetical protein